MPMVKSATAPLASPPDRFISPRRKYAIAIRGSDRIALLMSEIAPLSSLHVNGFGHAHNSRWHLVSFSRSSDDLLTWAVDVLQLHPLACRHCGAIRSRKASYPLPSRTIRQLDGSRPCPCMATTDQSVLASRSDFWRWKQLSDDLVLVHRGGRLSQG